MKRKVLLTSKITSEWTCIDREILSILGYCNTTSVLSSKYQTTLFSVLVLRPFSFQNLLQLPEQKMVLPRKYLVACLLSTKDEQVGTKNLHSFQPNEVSLVCGYIYFLVEHYTIWPGLDFYSCKLYVIKLFCFSYELLFSFFSKLYSFFVSSMMCVINTCCTCPN